MAICSYYSNVMKQCFVIHEIQSEVLINPLRPYTPANEDKFILCDGAVKNAQW